MRRHGRTALGILLSVLLLWWALRDVSATEVLQEIRAADPALFGLSIIIALVGFWFRAVRWGVFLEPIQRGIPFRPRLAATFIGFAANNVLPARMGEVVRAFSLARLTPVSLSAAFATLVMERLFDALALVGLLFGAMATRNFPSATSLGGLDVRSAATFLGVGMCVVAIGLYIVVAAPARAAWAAEQASKLLPRRLRAPVLDALRGFAKGLGVLKSGRLFLISAALGLGQWVFLALSFYVGFRAFGIDQVPFTGAVFLQSLISLAVAIPSSPGFFGPFEAAARVGLGLWEVPAQQAISFAIGFHIAGFLPVIVIGGYYLWRTNVSLSDLSSGASETASTDGHVGRGRSAG